MGSPWLYRREGSQFPSCWLAWNLIVLSVLASPAWSAEPAAVPKLQEQLLREGTEVLATAARERGDSARGAVVFYRPELTCTRCHTPGEDGPGLGPDLAKAGPEATDVYLIESVLLPSKVIKKGFETVTITTKAGKIVSGLLADDRADAQVLRDPSGDGKLAIVAKKEIDSRTVRIDEVARNDVDAAVS